MSKSVLFVDSNVKDYQTLLAGLGSNVEVHLLNAEEDFSFPNSMPIAKLCLVYQ